MAFVTFRAGDRFAQRASSNVPKTTATGSYAAPWAAGVTTPLEGHLVIQDTTALLNDGVARCPVGAGGGVGNPYGIIESVNSQNGTVSVWKLSKIFSLVLEYAGAAPTLGLSIQAHGSIGTIPIGGVLRDRVKSVAVGTGVGVIVAIDEPKVGLLVVEFGAP